MRRNFIGYSIVWVVLLLVFLGSGSAVGKKLESAPGLSLKDIKDMEGDDVTLSSLEGKVVLLNFFTTTWEICRAEFPHLIAVNDRYSDNEDVKVVGVAIDPMLEPIESLVRIIKINYTVLFGKLETLVEWKVRGFPTTFVINGKGEISKKYIGFRDKSVFIDDIEAVLSVSP